MKDRREFVFPSVRPFSLQGKPFWGILQRAKNGHNRVRWFFAYIFHDVWGRFVSQNDIERKVKSDPTCEQNLD